jgi:hypothetical protein
MIGRELDALIFFQMVEAQSLIKCSKASMLAMVYLDLVRISHFGVHRPLLRCSTTV